MWHPFSPMAWDNMADHWIEDFEDLVDPTRAPTTCSACSRTILAMRFRARDDQRARRVRDARFQMGGVKLMHFMKKRPESFTQEFARRWRDEHAPAVLQALEPLGILRKYVQNPRLPLDPAIFKGTLFEAGGVGQHAGIEEFWFDSLDDLERLRSDTRARNRIVASDRELTADGSFSMVTTERVVFDYVTPGRQTPSAAVLTPGTLEAMIDAQGYTDFNIPRPPGTNP